MFSRGPIRTRRRARRGMARGMTTPRMGGGAGGTISAATQAARGVTNRFFGRPMSGNATDQFGSRGINQMRQRGHMNRFRNNRCK